MRIAGFTALLATLLLAIGGSSAFAQSSPSQRGYDESLGVIGEIQSEEPQQPEQNDQSPTPSPTPPPPPQQQQAGDLPFTGLDIGIVALMGVLLVGTGLVLRRTTRREHPTS